MPEGTMPEGAMPEAVPEGTASEQTTAGGKGGGVLGQPNLHRPRDTHAGDPRFPFGWCASPEAPTPLSVPAPNPRFATDPGVRRLRGRCPRLPDRLRARLAWREAPVRRDGGGPPGRSPPLRADPPLVAFRAGPRSGVGADTEGRQLPPRIRLAASVRFFTPSAL
jgi:hypothetical protein